MSLKIVILVDYNFILPSFTQIQSHNCFQAESMEEAALKTDHQNSDEEDDEEAADMEEFEESGMLEDDQVRTTGQQKYTLII